MSLKLEIHQHFFDMALLNVQISSFKFFLLFFAKNIRF